MPRLRPRNDNFVILSDPCRTPTSVGEWNERTLHLTMKIEIKIIQKEDPLVKMCAAVVQKHSWGLDYPVKVIDEMRHSEYLIAAVDGKKLIGCASMGRGASPDKIDNDKLWFGNALILQKYRRFGIFKKMYQKCLTYINKKPGPVFACTENLIMVSFLLKNGWKYYRTTKDESGGICLVFKK